MLARLPVALAIVLLCACGGSGDGALTGDPLCVDAQTYINSATCRGDSTVAQSTWQLDLNTCASSDRICANCIKYKKLSYTCQQVLLTECLSSCSAARQ